MLYYQHTEEPLPIRDEAITMWKTHEGWKWRASIYRSGDKARTIIAEGVANSPVYAANQAQKALTRFWAAGGR